MTETGSPVPQSKMAVKQLSDSRRGAAAIELAILLPLFLTLVLACVDFGRFAYTYIGVTNSARAAAGYAVINPFSATTQPVWQAAVRQAAVDEMQQMRALFDSSTEFFDQTKMTVQSTRTIETQGYSAGLWYVTIEVHYPFQTMVNWPLLPSSVDLDRTIVMRGIR